MADSHRPIQFRDYLPEMFGDPEVAGELLEVFLEAFEGLYEELQAEIEGAPGDALVLAFDSAEYSEIEVDPFSSPAAGFPAGTKVTAPGWGLTTELHADVPGNAQDVSSIRVKDSSFAARLEPEDAVVIEGGPELLFRSVRHAQVAVAPQAIGAIGYPAGSAVTVERCLCTTLATDIAADTVLNAVEVADADFAGRLEANTLLVLTDDRGYTLVLTVQGASGNTVTVYPVRVGSTPFAAGTAVEAIQPYLRTALTEDIDPNAETSTIQVADASFAVGLRAGDALTVYAGGIPDLFGPASVPPPQFSHRAMPDDDLAHLQELANWVGLPLRADKPVDWNRRFAHVAIGLSGRPGVLSTLDALLRAWLKGELMETAPPLLIISDLTRTRTDVDTVFQLDDAAPPVLGVNTVLGEGPPFFFVVDLITDPAAKELRNPTGLDCFSRAALVLLDREKPAHTYYQLRVRAHTVQLAEPGKTRIDGNAGAQIGLTTLLWDGPWVFNSHG